jgi:hypothetical protein
MELRSTISTIWGALIGFLTFGAGPISWTSANPIIAVVQWVALILIVPGLLGGVVVGGNVHNVALGTAAVINALFHFGLSWLLFPLFKRRTKGPDEARR